MNRNYGKSEQDPGGSELIENSVLRETENEIIDQFTIKINNNLDDFVIHSDCEDDRNAILELCRRSKFCKPSFLQSSLVEMCQVRGINEMSVNALEQFIIILGVISMCMGLYVGLCILEKIVHTLSDKEEQKYD
ncbi:hypothetical protein TCAL_02896 [Tigriopus californicus]|uniref:Uncharacterized protein n=1 Tax=Tigriopus californicus TaxID=6832 RepID=A0A553NYN2_TIGCA|nr:uncharacterized protein LOC131885998 [Tigriopus californicus]TRY70541.1 hypothetical protein TCAL_02896 [Tigriopus californicus]|eukprot:TCALIF_02896-PA protein Name:"Protein of unknown function" AED:0.02 eAED:0.02 QI:338/1/0.5/1/1/1/2/0/133